MPPPDLLHRHAIVLACAYFRARFFYVEKTQSREDHQGYHLIAHRAKDRVTIVVKAAKCRWGIPDLEKEEVTESSRLAADFLLVACPRHKRGYVLLIPRDAITPEHLTPSNRGAWRIRTTLANPKSLSLFLHPI